MKTANLAIVFTDIKGFTARTSQQTYEENARMLRVHDALLMPVFKAFGGRKIKEIGDAFLVVFESPTQAVLCGVAIQDRLWDYNRRVAEPEQILVRVAINMGEVRLEGGDVFGEPVNIAARLEGVADAGEVVFSEAVYLSMNKAEVPYEDHGLHELKGIPEKIRAYRVPRGTCRLAPDPKPDGAPVAALQVEGPPYGGQALARITDLPAPEPTQLAAGDLKDRSAKFAQQAARQAMNLPKALRYLSEALGGSIRAFWILAIAGGVALSVGLAVSFLGGNPVESALSSGDLKRAEAEVRKVKPGSWRSFLEGRLDEERKDWSGAARHYEEAARADRNKAYKRLIEMTEREECWARANAAAALARLKRRSALSALKTLRDGSFADEPPSDNPFKELFGCSSRRAAAEAIKSIEGSREE